MKRPYKMRAYPTMGQAGRGHALMRAHCELYNAALQERRDAWRMNRVSISCFDQILQLKAIREVCRDQALWSSASQRYTLRRLQRSFDDFFRRMGAGQTPGYPRFRKLSRFDTVDHVNGDGAKWTPTEGRWAHAYFKGVGTLKVNEHRPVVGRVTQISLKREGRRWYVICVAESEPEQLAPAGREIGVDVGIARFLTTSDGEVIVNPRFLRSCADGMVELQRALARCKPGSGNRRRAKRAIGKLHRKIRNRRLDFHHKEARKLIESYDVIAYENLNVAGMSKRPKPRPLEDGTYEANGASAKAGLNRSILDVAWSQFISILSGKAECAGRRTIAVDPRNTSIDCHLCGARCTRPTQDTVICSEHGPLDADLNGARNIFTRAGLGSGQAAA